MKLFLVKLFVFLLLLLAEHAVLSILVPDLGAPLVIISAAIAWTLLRGFPESLWFLIPLILASDIFIDGRLDYTSAFLVLVAYGVSFISKRFVVEHRALAVLFHGMLVAGAAYLAFLLETAVRMGAPAWLPPHPIALPLLSILVFALTLRLLERFDRFLVQTYQDQTLRFRA